MNASDKLSRLVITCGGTGGHFYPGLSIAIEAKDRGCEVLLLLSGVNSVTQSAIASSAGICAVALPRMPHPGSPLGAVRFIFGMIGGWLEAMRRFGKFRPQALLGMGSFAMTPVVLAAWMRRIPVFLHDGNTVIGRGNRIFSRLAAALGCAFPPVNPESIHCRRELVGMPVRPEVRKHAAISKEEAVSMLNLHCGASLSPDLPTVLVVGGSQGAAIFNTVFPEAFRSWESSGKGKLQVLHLSGRGKLEDAKKAYDGFSGPLLLLDSSEHIEWFLGAADLVFARSGGSTLAELTVFGKPAVLIPYPFAAEDHQRHNAEWLVDCGGGRIIANSQLDVAAVLRELDRPVAFWHACAEASHRAAIPDAAEKMLALIEKALQ